jgi:serine/threonine protein phosphatase PrpC
MSKEPIIFEISAKTDKGQVREKNEDNYIVCPDLSLQNWFYKIKQSYELHESGCLLAIADGMGGHTHGQIASKTAIDTIEELGKKNNYSPLNVQDFFAQVFSQIKDKLINAAKEQNELKGMGTTLVLALILPNKIHLSWIGDSRAYLINQQGIYQLTRDHTVLQQLIDESGPETEIENEANAIMGHVLTRCLATNNIKLNYEELELDLIPGDKILLCSDGLTGMLSDDEIKQIVDAAETSSISELLVEKANSAGGLDNITVVFFSSNQNENTVPRSILHHSKSTFNSTIKDSVTLLGNSEYSKTTQNPRFKKKSPSLLVLLLIFSFIVSLFWYFSQNDSSPLPEEDLKEVEQTEILESEDIIIIPDSSDLDSIKPDETPGNKLDK